MKKLLFSLLFTTLSFVVIAQTNTKSITIDSEEYQLLKSSGGLNGSISQKFTLINNNDFIPSPYKGKKGGTNDKSGGCGCYVTPDGTYTQALAPNDDGSTALLPIPFTFCLYGTNYTSLYINNNGNISFGSPYSTFSSNPFPDPNFVMVAPFWGDVDTRGAGTVSYKITPTAMYINWEGVGYYSMATDKLNTFQLIITDGTDPVLPAGNNIAFCYGDMQWTTGSASGGTNGFGGTPATVGVNKGDGISFMQLGRFDQPGSAYDGAGGANDGVSWLDNQSFYFNVCSGTNIAPIANFSPAVFNSSGGGSCDTLRMCGVEDTLIINSLFLSPEIGETTTVTINTYGTPGISVLSNTPGNPANASVQVIASAANAGMNTITYTAVDNGTPAQTTIVNLSIFVDTTGLSAFNPVIQGNLEFCDGGNTTLTVNPSNLDSYIWNTGSIDTTITADSTGIYWVTSELNGCFKTVSVDVVEHPDPTPIITGDTVFCPGDSVLLNANAGYSSYVWSTSANDTLDSVYVTQGTYTVSVVDTNGCSGISAPFTVSTFTNTLNILGDTSYCTGDSVLLDAGIGFDTYLWNTGDTTQTIYVTQGTYTVDITLNSCTATDSHTVTEVIVPTPVITGLNSYCAGSSVTLDADSIGTGYDTFSWNTTPTQTSQQVNVTQGSYVVTVTLNGCSDSSAAFVVTENPLPTPTITGNLFYCGNDSNGTTLSTMNGYSQYSWSNGSNTQSTVASSGTIIVTVADAIGCQGSDTVVVTSSTPNNTITGITGFCPGETITLNADPGFSSYLWDSGETTDNIVAGAGSHSVMVTDGNGCTDNDTVTLVPNPAPNALYTVSPLLNAQPNQPVVFTDASSISVGSIVSWDWNFDVTGIGGATPPLAVGQGPHTVVYSLQGNYTVSLTVVADNTCTSTYSRDYLIISDIIVPNVITPNGDNYNDFLVFSNLEYHSGNHIVIFNRWGKKVYETTNYANDWDGGGHTNGTYYFVLTVDDLEDPIKGTVTILD